MAAWIAVVGDRDDAVTAHRAIDACVAAAPDVRANWVPTPDARDGVRAADGVWCAPASPYADTEAALAAITHARTAGVPFLGTCGGYQHAIIEFARRVLGEPGATSAELDPVAPGPLIAPLGCALYDAADEVRPVPGTLLGEIWGDGPRTPEYNCGYGLDPGRAGDLAAAGLGVCARAVSGEPRAVELDGHPFFLGVAFQPEREALTGALSPIVAAFFRAAEEHAAR